MMRFEENIYIYIYIGNLLLPTIFFLHLLFVSRDSVYVCVSLLFIHSRSIFFYIFSFYFTSCNRLNRLGIFLNNSHMRNSSRQLSSTRSNRRRRRHPQLTRPPPPRSRPPRCMITRARPRATSRSARAPSSTCWTPVILLAGGRASSTE